MTSLVSALKARRWLFDCYPLGLGFVAFGAGLDPDFYAAADEVEDCVRLLAKRLLQVLKRIAGELRSSMVTRKNGCSAGPLWASPLPVLGVFSMTMNPFLVGAAGWYVPHKRTLPARSSGRHSLTVR